MSKDLANQRSFYGFDDIPVDTDMRDVRFRDIMKAWVKQGIKHSPLEKRQKHLAKFAKNKKLASWKDDLKWALQADLDEPVAPHQKSTPEDKSSDQASHPHPIAQRPSTRSSARADAKTIDINVNFGSMPRLPKPSLAKVKPLFRSRKFLAIAGVLCVVVIGGFVGLQFFLHPNIRSTALGGASHPTPGTPDYGTVLPSGKSIDKLGGWSRVSPPNRDPVFAYADKIDTTPIIISQQPLPQDFKSDPKASVEKLASGFHSDTKVEAGSITAYVGTSAKGPQSVIFTKDGLLILIKSEAKIDNTKWGHYISSLQ